VNATNGKEESNFRLVRQIITHAAITRDGQWQLFCFLPPESQPFQLLKQDAKPSEVRRPSF